MPVIIPDNLEEQPKPHEIETALVLSKHYHVDVTFLAPINTYKRKTPDIEMSGVQWELKSPTSKSKKSTIRNQVAEASHQSKYVVIDGNRTKLEDDFIQCELEKEFKSRKGLKRVLYVNKKKVVIEIHK